MTEIVIFKIRPSIKKIQHELKKNDQSLMKKERHARDKANCKTMLFEVERKKEKRTIKYSNFDADSYSFY